MPPPSPRDSPDLERALPGDATAGTGLRVGDSAEVLFGDGVWRWVRILGEWRSTRGWVVQLEWHAGGLTWGGEYVYDDAKFRE